MKLTINEYYDDETGEYIASKFYIDGEECTEEEHCEMLDALDRVNTDEDECDGNCDECLLNEEEELEDFCDCPECTILRYVEEIQEITGGCPGYIEECLTRFFIDIIEHIVIENDEENNNDRGKFN